MDNRRRSVRVKIDKAAEISSRDGQRLRHCSLRNISSRGARLILGDHTGLPDEVVLSVPADKVSWPCRIVRREAGEIGVLFT